MKDFYQQSPCPICGNREYSWGAFVGYGLAYRSNNVPFLQGLFASKQAVARHCDICGNVQIFTRDEVEENR